MVLLPLKAKAKKWILTALTIIVNLCFWAVPSNIAYQVAQQREVLLGRYTVDRFTALLVILIISIFVVAGIWTKKKETEKAEQKFKIIALTVSIILSIIAADILVRIIHRPNYVGTKTSYHRPPSTVTNGNYTDAPETHFSYPATPPGFGELNYILTVDKRVFRNTTDFEKYDVIVLGDSFTEGSRVSDNQT